MFTCYVLCGPWEIKGLKELCSPLRGLRHLLALYVCVCVYVIYVKEQEINNSKFTATLAIFSKLDAHLISQGFQEGTSRQYKTLTVLL